MRGPLVALAALVQACALPGDPAEASRSALGGRVYDWVDDPAEQARRDAVVGLHQGCAGTLITPRLVLTAWHCTGGHVEGVGGHSVRGS